jgi:hypothetical protein
MLKDKMIRDAMIKTEATVIVRYFLGISIFSPLCPASQAGVYKKKIRANIFYKTRQDIVAARVYT